VLGLWFFTQALVIFFTVHHRFQQLMHPPIFVPPMKFAIDLTYVPSYFVNDLPESTKALSYSHDSSFFNLSHEKRLTFYDISTSFTSFCL
jgi:hypothetical protein